MPHQIDFGIVVFGLARNLDRIVELREKKTMIVASI